MLWSHRKQLEGSNIYVVPFDRKWLFLEINCNIIVREWTFKGSRLFLGFQLISWPVLLFQPLIFSTCNQEEVSFLKGNDFLLILLYQKINEFLSIHAQKFSTDFFKSVTQCHMFPPGKGFRTQHQCLRPKKLGPIHLDWYMCWLNIYLTFR